jgi:succinate dehydrogenase hydrophobic anchor subunit
MSLRTPLGKVLGSGSAGEGTTHWWVQRVTAIALIPLTLWFAASILGMPLQSHAAMSGWLGHPWVGVFTILLAITLAWHSGSACRWSSKITSRQGRQDRPAAAVHVRALRGRGRGGIRRRDPGGLKNMKDYEFIDRTYDVVVVGAGGAGLRATLGLAEAGLTTACITKVFPQPHRGGTGRHFRRARQHGRRRLALPFLRHHQGFGLARRPGRHRTMCKEAPAAVIELEHYGVPFFRTNDGRIYQRPSAA